MAQSNQQTAMRVSRHNIIWNVLLSVFTLLAGLLAHSVAMISDAVNTISDIFSTVIVMIGIRLANQKPDKEHPYGHERFECVTAMVLGAFLAVTGLAVGWTGLSKIMAGEQGTLQAPGLLALLAAFVSVLVKEGLFRYTRKAARKIDSSALMADALHHRSDVFASLGSFAGILGARLGWPVLDPVACLVICLFILKSAVAIFRDAIGKMTDKACDAQMAAHMREVILAQEAVQGIDQMKTRLFGDKIYVDVEISADGTFTLAQAHDTAQRVHDAIETQFPKVKHCMVHVNPAQGTEETV